MPRPRSPDRDKALELYLKNKGRIQLNAIADQLNLSEGTVRGWKAKDDWEGTLSGTPSRSKKNTERSKQKAERRIERSKHNKKNPSIKISKKVMTAEKAVKSKPETDVKTHPTKARPGNKNAAGPHKKGAGGPIGNKHGLGNAGGHGGPIRNKHALTTGEYETIFFDAIVDEEEKALLKADYDKYRQIYLLIDTLTIREVRILRRIKDIEATPGGMVFDSITKNKGIQTTRSTNRSKGGDEWLGNVMALEMDNSSHVAKPTIKRLMELEDALTRVQSQKRQAIAQLHRMEMGDEMLALRGVSVDLSFVRIENSIQTGDIAGIQGGNFIEALEDVAGEVWDDDADD